MCVGWQCCPLMMGSAQNTHDVSFMEPKSYRDTSSLSLRVIWALHSMNDKVFHQKSWLKVTYPNYIQTPGEEFRNE